MEPTLTAMVSQLFYDGRLNANPANAINAISWRQPCFGSVSDPLPDQSLVSEAVEHNGCSVYISATTQF